MGKNEIIHSRVANGGWGLRCIEVVWTQLVMRWTLRALKMENTTTLKNLDYMEINRSLDMRDPESSGHGKTIKKSKIYSSDNIWENACDIMVWTIQSVLKKKICFDHQPLLDNKLIMKSGKMINKNQLPEIDFGPATNVRALKDNRIEIFNGQDELNKTLTWKIFFNFAPVDQQNFPECCDDCRQPMKSLMFSKKFANGIICCLLFGKDLDTGIKVKASLAAYIGELLDQPNINNQMKMSNPKKKPIT